MSDQPPDGGRGWVSRLRERGAERRAIRADRRARRRARSMGASPDDAARQAASRFANTGYLHHEQPAQGLRGCGSGLELERLLMDAGRTSRARALAAIGQDDARALLDGAVGAAS